MSMLHMDGFPVFSWAGISLCLHAVLVDFLFSLFQKSNGLCVQLVKKKK
jgi:hypothetical protein